MFTNLIRQAAPLFLIAMVLNCNFAKGTEPTKKLSLIGATTLFKDVADQEELDEKVRGRLLYSMDVDGVTNAGSHGGRTGDDDQPVKRTIRNIINSNRDLQLDQIFIDKTTGDIIIKTKKSNVVVSEEQDS